MTPFSLSRRTSPNPAVVGLPNSVTAVSLNMAKETTAAKVISAIEGAPRLRSSDVYLFQEVRHRDGKPSVADEVAAELNYQVAFTAAPGFTDQGLAIVSRFPISDIKVNGLKACDLRFRSRSRFSMAATVQTPAGNVRVWNVHLDTRINAAERLAQLQPVIDEAACQGGPKLIAGDFNTNELYWIGNVFPLPIGPAHGSMIRDSMKVGGFNTPFQNRINTFPLFRSHLDWIFLSELDPLEASVEPAPFSDHNAIWVHAKL